MLHAPKADSHTSSTVILYGTLEEMTAGTGYCGDSRGIRASGRRCEGHMQKAIRPCRVLL